MHMPQPTKNGHTSGVLEVAGIGMGPNNLGLAALFSQTNASRIQFFERRSEFQWHPGMLFPDATVQVSFLKDLVSMVDPTNPYSFLNFLSKQNRLYRYSHAKNSTIKRAEFNAYFRWAVESLSDHIEFNQEVKSVDWLDGQFHIQLSNGFRRAQHLVLGNGLVPKVPACAIPHLGDSVFHVSQFLKHISRLDGKRVTVVGGGQSGAEIVKLILQEKYGLPEQLNWVSSRTNYHPLDDSPFANEYFSPAYSAYFSKLPSHKRTALLNDQLMSSDGVDLTLLDEIYELMYTINYQRPKSNACRLLPDCRVADIFEAGDSMCLAIQPKTHEESMLLTSDIVILATGFEYQTPAYLEPLMPLIEFEHDRFIVNDDYSIQWAHQQSNHIYVQNAAAQQRGIADPNLSLSAWRNAKIINSILGHERYAIERQISDTVFDWSQFEQPNTTGISLALNGQA